MTPADDKESLSGMARAVDALFTGAKDRAAEGDDDVVDGGEAVPSDAPLHHDEVRSADPLMDMEFVPLEEDGEDGGMTPEPDGPSPTDVTDVTDVTDPTEAPEAMEAMEAPEAPDGAGPPRADLADDLAEAVDDFLADAAPREKSARRIRDLALRAREEGVVEPVARAAERLARDRDGQAPGQAEVALARMLTTPLVASRITARLGAERDEDRKAEAIRTASRLGPEMAAALGEALSHTEDRAARRTYMDALIALKREGMVVVEGMVEDSRWFVARNAVLILGEAGGEDAVQHLTTTLAHDDARVRKETLLALAKIGGEDAAMLVLSKLDDADPDVRAAAARGAGALGIERAVKPLLGVLEDEQDEDVQIAVLRALGRIGDPGAVQAIEKKAVGSFFSRAPTPVRVAAYRALAEIGTPHARSLLEQAVEDRDKAVQAAARSALEGD